MRKSYKSLCVPVLLIFICLVGTGISGPFVSLGLQINESDEETIKNAIYSYFTVRYKALQTNKPQDFSTLIDNQDANTEWLKQEEDKRNFEVFIHSTYGVIILDYSFNLEFKRIAIDQDNAIVNLIESNEITYESNPTNPSSMGGIEHAITLSRTKDGWALTNDVYSDDMTRLLRISSTDEILKNIQINHDRIVPEFSSIDQSTLILQNPNLASGWQMYTYSNSIAGTYADNNYNQAGPVPTAIRNLDGWNSSWPTSYKVYGSDCTNFVSQAVFEGVSYTASDTNYFYPDSNHYSDWWYYKFSPTTDGSSPWVNVGDFYNFLTTNYFNYSNWDIGVRGPAGYPVGLCNIQVGDTIFMWAQSAWQHAVIVDQIGANPCDANNVYVAAHSAPYKRRPLSEYSGYLMYPVEIKGYLDEYHQAFFPMAISSEGGTESSMQTPYPAPEDSYQLPYLSPSPYPEP